MSARTLAVVAFAAAPATYSITTTDAEAVSPAPSARTAPPLGDPRRGADIYDTKCGACHSLDANRVGPAHRGVFGRRAGAAPNYIYSIALKSSGLIWTTRNLDRWLSGPGDIVSGTKMGFRLASAQDRADVIAYLRTVSPPSKPAATPARKR